MDDYIKMAAWMKEQGVDLIDVSSGAVAPAKISPYPGYQVPFAEKIKTRSKYSYWCSWSNYNRHSGGRNFTKRTCRYDFLARALLRDPYWPRTAARELGYELEAPKQYERGW